MALDTSTNKSRDRADFRILAANLSGLADIGISVSASRCGAYGVLNLEALRAKDEVADLVQRAACLAASPIAVRLDPSVGFACSFVENLPAGVDAVILPCRDRQAFGALADVVTRHDRRLIAEVTSGAEAERALTFPVDALLAKGHESGGYVREETAFVLLQRLLREYDLPVYVWGGIGTHTIGACYAAGASGVVLDSQLLLTPQATVPPQVRARLERMEGDETTVAGADLGQAFRFYCRPGLTGALALIRAEEDLIRTGTPSGHREWRAHLDRSIQWKSDGSGVWPIGQDAVFAAPLARQFHTLAGIVDGLQAAAREHVSAARRLLPLSPGSTFAHEHGITYPILQGPMTRVSDTAAFAKAVADGGALPFLALALLRKTEATKLLAETKQLLGNLPWGVGILGFVPADLREEQLEVIEEIRPTHALIAGGRPDQAERLERLGIPTYLHVPAPSLLELFLNSGARRFVFEGRECGGHVGPRTSFVLWDSMIEKLLGAIRKGIPPHELYVVFAGGIHDAQSSAMVSAMAAPLANLGVRIAVLMGTAYLFTEEAVASRSIVEGFQREAILCRDTVTLVSGPGHLTRCASTPFNDVFREERRRFLAEGRTVEQTREALEALNLGRLRIASKGVIRKGAGQPLESIDAEEQRRQGMYMIGQVAALRDRVCTIADLHEEVSTAATDWVTRLEDVPSASLATPEPEIPPCDIAIIGMGCLLPGAPDVATFWRNILTGRDAVGEIPRERFDVDHFYDADPGARDKVYSRSGGFLDPVPFDPVRFGIPPAALTSIDSMQLLALVVADQALKDAGYDQRPIHNRSTSVILGASGGLGDLGIDYAIRSNLPQVAGQVPEEVLSQLPEWTEDSFAGILPNVTAGRIANRFNFGGLNFTVDAACASALAAIYLAARELSARTSDMVIAGGVDTVQSPFGFLCFSKSHALSPRGRCSPFDNKADGIAISEGLSMVVLKRLKDAERDGDRIYAVIRGVGGSSDGRGRGMTAPRAEGQQLAIQRAWTQAGVRASSLELIEAHGTGTAVGDATEVEALADLFKMDGAGEHSCVIGSVKSMVGHTKSAAGVTGLMKVALALHHKVLPPTLHVEQPNSALSGKGVPLYINTEARPWIARPDGSPRQAGVSAFGFGGTNFHAILAEYTGDTRAVADRCAAQSWPQELFVWHAATAEGLRVAVNETSANIDSSVVAAYLACELAARAGEPDARFRLAVIASSPAELKEKLAIASQWLSDGKSEASDTTRGIHLGSGDPHAGVGFLFPGQGSQYPGMLREVAVYVPEMGQNLAACDRHLQTTCPQPISRYIYPASTFSEERTHEAMAALTETDVAQPALACLEMGLFQFLSRVGIRPDFVAGHSFGEYVALCAAGVISISSLFELSAARGRAIRHASGPNAGGMVAATASPDHVRRALRDLPDVTLANLNAPRQTVLAGANEVLTAAISRLQKAGIESRRVPVACAFHSPLMEPARAILEQELAKHSFQEPNIPVFSNTLGGPYPTDPDRIREILADHLVRPVDFASEVKAMYEQGARTFIEVGPRSVLGNLGRQILDSTGAKFFSIDSSREQSLFALLNVLGALDALGVPVDVSQLFRGRDRFRSVATGNPGWLVTGSRAYPANEPHPRKHPWPLQHSAPVFSPAFTTASTASIAPQGLPPGSDAVMAQFQQVMGQFLSVQEAVMTSFLQGTPNAALPLTTLPTAAQHISAEVPEIASVASPPIPSPGAERDFRSRFLRLAADRTGYPVEMLKLDAGIEADLGIDSIKRIEILGGFRLSRSPEEQARLHDVMDALTGAKTLRELLGHIDSALSATPVQTHEPASDVPRMRLVAVDAPQAQSSRPFEPGSTVLITDDESGVATGVAEEIGRQGAWPVLLRHATAELDQPDSVRLTIEAARRQHGPIRGLLHLIPLRDTGRESLDLLEWRRDMQADLRSLHLLVREALPDLQEVGDKAVIACATARGGDFGLRPIASVPVSHFAVADYVKCLSLEVKARCKVIDLDPGDPVGLLRKKFLQELGAADQLLQAGLPGNRRLTVLPEPLQISDARPKRIDSDWVFLLTGGARGIVAVLARELAKKYRARLVLAGRSPVPDAAEPTNTAHITDVSALRSAILAERRASNPNVKPAEVEAACKTLLRERELRSTLRDLKDSGAQVEYVPVDVTNESAMTELIERIYRKYGRLDAVVHGAGIIEDRLVRDKTPESFDRVVHTKADSSFLLARLLRPESLQCLIFMSSVTAAFGNYGQTDYAAANGFMNGFATQLAAAWPCRTVAMNWGPWDQTGMVSEGIRDQFRSRGVQLIPPASGVRAILREIENGGPDSIVVLGDGPWAAAAPVLTEVQASAVGASA